MALYLNSKKISSLALGQNIISSIYLGNKLIYSSSAIKDPLIKYFEYILNKEEKTITIIGIYYDLWYQDFGNYNIIIPDSFAGIDQYKVIVVFD